MSIVFFCILLLPMILAYAAGRHRNAPAVFDFALPATILAGWILTGGILTLAALCGLSVASFTLGAYHDVRRRHPRLHAARSPRLLR